jgi:putative transposase
MVVTGPARGHLTPIHGCRFEPGTRYCAWHQTLKHRILLEHYYLPSDLEAQVGAFIEHYNHAGYHESLGNLTAADVYCGRGPAILRERERIKRQTIATRRLQHHAQAA